MRTEVETTVAAPARRPAAEGGAPAGPEERPSDESVAAVRAVVLKQPLHREILYRTLGYCREQRALPDVEQEIATYPEFEHSGQDQYHLISFLAAAGGLDCLELDEDGELVTEARKAGLSEDEVDDLVVSFAYVTTDAGAAVFEELDPRKRLRELLEGMPEQATVFARILELCTVSRAYTEIERLLGDLDEDDEDLSSIRSVYDADTPHPSVVVSNMERAGALVWDDGWRRTEEGRAMLDMIRQGSWSSGT